MATLVQPPSVNFNLSGGPDLPSRVRPFPLIDVAGAEASAAEMGTKISAAREQIRARADAENDRKILSAGVKSGEIDLFTPAGVRKALETLRGRVSLDTFTKLNDRAAELRTVDMNLQKSLQQMDEAARKQYTAGLEASMPFLDALMRSYAQDVETGGEAAAQEKFTQNRDRVLQQMRGKRVAPGVSMFSEEVISSLADATPEVLPGIISASKYQTDIASNISRMAAAQRPATGTENFIDADGNVVISIPGTGVFNAETRELWTGDPSTLRPLPTARGAGGAGGVPGAGMETLRGSDGNTYLANSRAGTVSVLNRETGQYEPLPGGVPQGVTLYKMGSAAEAQAAVRTGRVVLTDEESQRISRITRMVKLNVPPFGQGEAGTNARNAFYKGLLADIDAQGQGDTEAAIRMAMARSSTKTRENMIQRDTILRSEEGEAVALLGKIQEELKKIGGPASPYVREKWNMVETRLLGNPTFAQLNLYMTQFVDTVGRLSSNATGAAGTPVAYLNFAKTVLDKDFNLEQVKAFTPAFQELVNARRTGVQEAFNYLNELGSAVTNVPGAGAGGAGGAGGGVPPAGPATARPGPTGEPVAGAGATRPPATARPPATTPPMGAGNLPIGEGQQPVDARISILRPEYDKAVERWRASKTPEERARNAGDVRAVRSELARLGVQVPDLPAFTPEPPGTGAVAPATALTPDQIARVRRAFGNYEPQKYDYRISPEGRVQRKPKVQQ